MKNTISIMSRSLFGRYGGRDRWGEGLKANCPLPPTTILVDN